ncbi:unnamed protein product [Amoebophrya sp. A120]|nr:unnamed protein product [Amoebophrya sp. A120]|eukprot:GSA120T00006328001.1
MALVAPRACCFPSSFRLPCTRVVALAGRPQIHPSRKSTRGVGGANSRCRLLSSSSAATSAGASASAPTAPTAAGAIKITASSVKKLREITGSSMGDCRRALVESQDDLDGALEWLKRRNVVAAKSRWEKRDAVSGEDGKSLPESLVAMAELVSLPPDDDSGAGSNSKTLSLVKIGAETDFVVRNQDFQKVCVTCAETLCNLQQDEGAANGAGAAIEDGSSGSVPSSPSIGGAHQAHSKEDEDDPDVLTTSSRSTPARTTEEHFENLLREEAKGEEEKANCSPAEKRERATRKIWKMKCQGILHQLSGRVGESCSLLQAVSLRGRHVFGYVHPGNVESDLPNCGKVGALVSLVEKEGDEAEARKVQNEQDKSCNLTDIGNKLCRHIAAMRPKYVAKTDVPEDILSSERQIYRAQASANADAAMAPSDQILDKIVAGKLQKWYQQEVLLEQAFLYDDKKTVGKVLTEIGVSVHQLRMLHT